MRSVSTANFIHCSSNWLWHMKGTVSMWQPSVKSCLWWYRLWQRMVNKCMAAGCSNTQCNCVHLFKCPSDAVLRCKWEKQIQWTWTRWKATEHSVLCSDHFTENCFEINLALASQFGIHKRRNNYTKKLMLVNGHWNIVWTAPGFECLLCTSLLQIIVEQ